jgi:hypothetical protein
MIILQFSSMSCYQLAALGRFFQFASPKVGAGGTVLAHIAENNASNISGTGTIIEHAWKWETRGG